MTTAPTRDLREVAPGVWAWLPSSGSWGHANCGLVTTSTGDTLVVDTPFTTALAHDLRRHVDERGLRVRWVVNTHANGDHCWGNAVFAGDGVEIVASAATGRGMHDEISPAVLGALKSAEGALGAYTQKFFDAFDFSDVRLVGPTRTFTGETTLDLGERAVRLVEVGPAHTDGDSIVHVPDAGVVFAGDILFVGDHPVMWSGPLEGWVAACDRILATGAAVVVPGHGPVVGPAAVREIKDYFETLLGYARSQHAAGTPCSVAAEKFPVDRWPDWGHPERLVVTLGTAYANFDSRAPDRAELLSGMADLYWRRHIPVADS